MNVSSTLYAGPTPPDLARIPRELKAIQQWVLWRGADKIEQKTGEAKLNKIPVDPQTLRNASTTDAATWGTLAQCVEALPVALEEWEQDNPATFRGGGLGFVFSPSDAYAGVDLDGCRDPHTGDIAPWAQAHIDALASYTEISQSTTGVHVVTKGTLPQRGNKKGQIEMYAHGRFFVMTGWRLPDTTRTITAHQEALYEVHGRVFGPQAIPCSDGTVVCYCPHCDYLATLGGDGRCPTCGNQPLGRSQGTTDPGESTPAAALSDTEVLDQARHGQDGTKFQDLWFGDVGTYPSASEADAALCTLLATYTHDPAQIDALFRRSGLMRHKWDERRGAQTYGERTIAQALQWQKENAHQPTLRVHGMPVSQNGTAPGPEPRDSYAYPELPDYARVNETAAAEASRFLDDYMAFSRKWAPRAYEGFHEASGLFTLSTVNARRTRLEFGPRGVYSSLYMGMVARTTFFTKTTAADLAIEVIKAAELGYLLADDDATPQAFLRSLTRYVPSNYDDLPEEERTRLCRQLAFTAQRGWFYEEWGQHLEAMMQKNSFMAAFRGILRRLDDHKERYVYTTISRGQEVIIKPYVTLLANVTPADLQPFVKAGSSLWRDGYIARMGFVVPNEADVSEAEYPKDAMKVPASLVKALQGWHTRLKIPRARITKVKDAKGKNTNLYSVTVSPLEEKTYTLSPGVRTAFYRYDQALRELTRKCQQEDLDGSYGRFPVKALRIAGLLGSLQDDGDNHEINLPQWYRGQQIAEHWRRDLHRLRGQLHEPERPSRQAIREERLLQMLKAKGPQTLATIHNATRWPFTEIATLCEDLTTAHILTKKKTTKTVKYALNGVAL